MNFQHKPIAILLSFTFIFSFAINGYSQDTIYKKCKGRYCHFEDAEGNKITKQKFNDAEYFQNGRAAVAIKNQWGFIDINGDIVIDLKYDAVSNFNQEKIAFVQEANNYYFIDNQGKSISENYDSIYMDIGSSRFITVKNNFLGIIDKAGNVLETPKFQELGAFYNDILTVKYQGEWGNWVDGQFKTNEAKLYFNVPNQFPIFDKKCIELEAADEQKPCSDKAMLETIYFSIKYPTEARINGVEGTFVINTEGTIEDAEVVRSVGGGCDEEGLRVLNSKLNNWAKPAIHDGQKVNMIFYLPIRYRLE